MSVLNFKEISSYLRHHILHLPKKGRGEISRIAKHLRVSTTLVSQVLAGGKTFTPEQTEALVGFLGLRPLEGEYLIFLSQRERAGSKQLKEFWNEKLCELRDRALSVTNRIERDAILSDEEKSRFYSNALNASIWLFTSVGEKGKSLEEICARFERPRAQISEVLAFLVESGLCVEKNGRYTMGPQKTHLEEGSPYVLRHHTNWRLRAVQKAERLSRQELMYTVPVSLSQKDFEILREEMVQFIKRFLDRVHASPSEELACFNMDFFWIDG